MRFMLNEKNRQNNDLQADIGASRDGINRKDAEITNTQRDLAHKSDNGFQLRKDLDNLSHEIN